MYGVLELNERFCTNCFNTRRLLRRVGQNEILQTCVVQRGLFNRFHVNYSSPQSVIISANVDKVLQSDVAALLVTVTPQQPPASIF